MTTTAITTTIAPSGERAHDVTIADSGIVTTTTGVLLGEIVDMKRRGWVFRTAVIGRPLPYGTKVAARWIARVAADDQTAGILNALNHSVAGYMSGLESTEWPVTYYCASCGNPEGSTDYAKPCCTADNMITNTGQED